MDWNSVEEGVWGGRGNRELGIMKSECERHIGQVLLVDLSSSLLGSGAVVEDRQLRMHSMSVRMKGENGNDIPRQKT
jgi:hypothetical protein